jgi:uncharacterized protein YdeI (YjbR/CyaY-like superfamily)
MVTTMRAAPCDARKVMCIHLQMHGFREVLAIRGHSKRILLQTPCYLITDVSRTQRGSAVATEAISEDELVCGAVAFLGS